MVGKLGSTVCSEAKGKMKQNISKLLHSWSLGTRVSLYAIDALKQKAVSGA